MAARRLVVAVLALAFSLMASHSFAEEARFDLNPGAGIKDILKDQTGKRVSIRLEAGEELEGTVTKVGDQLVHISRLSRRDFYDAVVRIDRISAVIIKAREK